MIFRPAPMFLSHGTKHKSEQWGIGFFHALTVILGDERNRYSTLGFLSIHLFTLIMFNGISKGETPNKDTKERISGSYSKQELKTGKSEERGGVGRG